MLELFSHLAIVPLVLFSVVAVIYGGAYVFYLNTHHSETHAEVTLVMAMTGPSANFQALLLKLNAQTLKPKQLLIGIESEKDPAYQVVLRYASSASFPIGVAVAGCATTTSQKCHNLLSAVSKLSPEDTSAIVLLDADISPPAWWLGALLKPIVARTADIVSGYRWQQANSLDLGAHLITLLDRAAAVLPRPQAAGILWGGSIALSRAAFDSVLRSGILTQTLSDELMLARYVQTQQYRILNRRLLLVPSQATKGLSKGWHFGVRQYQVMKIYRPKIWCLALLVSLLSMLGWVSLIYHSIYSPQFLALLLFILLCSATTIANAKSIADKLLFKEPRQYWAYQYCLAIAKPLVDVFECTMLIASISTQKVKWGHVTYLVKGPRSIRAIRGGPEQQ